MKRKLIKNFNAYVSNYDINDEAIKRKWNHSIRVMKISELIAKNLKLKSNDRVLAMIIGLLHDYARFEQWKKYHTYSDLNSIDHGDLGVELLFDNNEIKNFTLDADNYDLIKCAIKYHNKYEYPNNLDPRYELHCDIIRDADKLDIFYIFATGIIKIDKSDEPISDKIKDEFYRNKLISRKDVKNKNDELILLLSMIYDLNFKVSLEYLLNNNYLWDLYNRLENKENYLGYFKHIDNYIKERLK